MKEKKESKASFLPWFNLVISLTCVVCLVHVQCSLYSYREQIDHLLIQVKKCKDDRINQLELREPQYKDVPLRSKRSDYTQGLFSTPSNYSAKSHHKIRDEISRQIQQIIKTQICVNNQKMCLRGPRGRRGRRGPRGPRGHRGSRGPMGSKGPVGKHGPPGSPCKRCNITIDNMPDLRGPSGPPGLPGPRGLKGEPGRTVSAASISIPPRSVTVNQSDIVSFYCGAKGYPSPKVSWHKINSSLPEGRYESNKYGGLLIQNITKSDEGTYKCIATNIFPGEAVAFAHLVVQDETKIVKKPSSVITEQGHTATFTCIASGNPTPKIAWSKAFNTIPAGRYKVSQERGIQTQKINGALLKTKFVSSNLTMMNLSTIDSGTYICEAGNKLNNQKVSGQLTVLPALSFRVLPPSRIEATEWDTVLIRCEAANAIGLSWKINPKSTNAFEHRNGSLEFKTTSLQDEGQYTCMTWNAYRRISAVVELKVRTPACKREKPLGMENRQIPDSSITASSIYSTNDAGHDGRLNNNPKHWAPSSNRVGEWLQVDFRRLTRVTKVATQGRPFLAASYIKSYSLSYRRENESWNNYVHASYGKTLPGNANYQGTVTNILDPKITIRYIRIYPKTWHHAITIRVEFYGCSWIPNFIYND